MVYLALAEIASDERSERFTRTIKQIADRAGVSYRTAFSILNRFDQLKLIAVDRHVIEGTKGRAPSTYTLCNGCTTLRRREGQSFAEKRQKIRTTTNDDNVLATTNAQQSSSSIPSFKEAGNHPLWKKLAKQYRRYCESRGGSPTEKGWQTWAGKQPPPQPNPNPNPNPNPGNRATQSPQISDAEFKAHYEKFKASNRKVFPQMQGNAGNEVIQA